MNEMGNEHISELDRFLGTINIPTGESVNSIKSKFCDEHLSLVELMEYFNVCNELALDILRQNVKVSPLLAGRICSKLKDIAHGQSQCKQSDSTNVNIVADHMHDRNDNIDQLNELQPKIKKEKPTRAYHELIEFEDVYKDDDNQTNINKNWKDVGTDDQSIDQEDLLSTTLSTEATNGNVSMVNIQGMCLLNLLFFSC